MADEIVIEWADPPEKRKNRESKFLPFFEALRERPGAWAKWPGKGTPASRLEAGGFSGVGADDFEVMTREGTTYIRAVEKPAKVRSIRSAQS